MLSRIQGGRNSCTLPMGTQNASAAVGKVWQFPNKLNMELPCDSATIPLLGMYPGEPKAGVQTSTPTRMFLAALFIIAKKMETSQMPIN